MASKAKQSHVVFRPHFKTHQSLEIGQWFKDAGVHAITVSSFEMAEYFATDWNDITVAFPVNILEINRINTLAQRIKLNLLIESTDVAQFLSDKITDSIGCYIKIDVGTHRTGINPERYELMDEIMAVIDQSDNLIFEGFLAHAGHTYRCRNPKSVQHIYHSSMALMKKIKNRFASRYPELKLSYGDTPSCSLIEDFSDVDEIRPGNFVFYDLMQVQISACAVEQVAMAVACPIVAIHKERSEVVIYGGGIHFSKEFLEFETSSKIFGFAVDSNNEGWGELIPKTYLKSLSQEHGIVSVPALDINKYRIGDCMKFLPVHSCMTMNLMRDFVVV